MRKSVLLSFVLCVCSLSACSMFSDTEVVSDSDEDIQIIDATIEPSDKCGEDGVSCNDTALINYTKTEADYKAYGEREMRDQLYTQAAAGNNLVATKRPAVDDSDVVTEYEPGYYPEDEVSQSQLSDPDDLFMQTAANDVVPQTPTQPSQSQQSPSEKSEVGHANNIGDSISGPGYEIVCTEECEDFSDIDSIGGFESNGQDSNLVTSEFTEDSFDIADYVKNHDGDDEDIEFVEIGDKTNAEDVLEVASTKFTEDTITTWDAKEGDNVRELLTQWSNKAGWKLLWNTNRNYVLSAGVMFKGKFTDVSSALIRAFARARPAPIATYYKGNRVIVVETMENENAY